MSKIFHTIDWLEMPSRLDGARVTGLLVLRGEVCDATRFAYRHASTYGLTTVLP